MDLRTDSQVLINRQIYGLMDRLASTDKQIDRWTYGQIYWCTVKQLIKDKDSLTNTEI